MQLNPGSRLGPYEIRGTLGAGGMGEVYRAHDEKLGRDIALKILPAEMTANSDALRRFSQEARAASALNHPNIVTIYDVGEANGIAWIAMELVEGNDLRTVIDRGRVDPKQAVRIAVKIAEGIGAAHARGIVHRDLKPENVMITAEGFVKVLDFGLAKQSRNISPEDQTMAHTVPGTVFGTVNYMSPEQTVGSELDPSSDQFSLGVLLYEMLTGKRPFERMTKPETMTAILRDHPPPASSVAEGVPPDLDRIIARCLAKEKQARYHSTLDLARDLREVREQLTSSHSWARRTTPPPQQKQGRSFRLVAVLAGALLTILGGVMVWRHRDAQPVDGIQSVAVLPFAGGDATPQERALAEGISEMIATRLSGASGLRVKAPIDVEASEIRGDAAEAGRKRGVDAVVRGELVQRDGAIRLRYSLVESKSGKILVESSTEVDPAELFALEQLISSDILDALGRKAERSSARPVSLSPADQRQFVEALGLLRRVQDEQSVDRAISILEALLANARESAPVNAQLARALLFKSSLARRPALIEQATIYARRAVGLDAADPESHITLGLLQNGAGKHAEALQSFERALAQRQGLPHAWAGIAAAYEGLGRARDADTAYQRALLLQPDSSGVRMAYGAFCYARGRYPDAVTQFTKVVELTPGFAHAHANLGAALQAVGRDREALDAYRRSIALSPTAAGWSNLGTMQLSMGKAAEARKSYEEATRLAPNDYTMWFNLGDACRSAGAREDARLAYDRAIATATSILDQTPADAMARIVLAASLARNGRANEAQEQIRRALENDPTNVNALYFAAVISAVRGNVESSASWLERAIKAGYPAAEIAHDPDLAQVREQASIRRLVQETLNQQRSRG